MAEVAAGPTGTDGIVFSGSSSHSRDRRAGRPEQSPDGTKTTLNPTTNRRRAPSLTAVALLQDRQFSSCGPDEAGGGLSW
jgi:hypothetical protein